MAGIYIHIPYCKQKCIYCNFHSSASLKNKDTFIDALIKEIEQRKGYISDTIDTIYIGGGTPSLLDYTNYVRIFEALNKYYDLSTIKECTLEANPDDLNLEKIKQFKNLPINRLSIGVQSLSQDILNYLGRIHQKELTLQAIKNVQLHWTTNISIDLIYGLPGLTKNIWDDMLAQITNLHIPHISCYALTIEPLTSLPKLLAKGARTSIDEEDVTQQMDMVVQSLKKLGYIQYEISNFCLPGKEALHNSNYWKQKPYIGFGPSAHSFNGYSRRWNISNNQQYIQSSLNENLKFEEEILSINDRYNEYIMTGLRTITGIDLNYIKNHFGETYAVQFQHSINSFIKNNWVKKENNNYSLSLEGIKVSDYIISILFIVK